ncbi:hypothetical protein BBJ28_00004641 [Nothophytophthora sp. Chile5]|nr:hypothetical protein BBJ28_00004641 [Nothophytophthora sp. Chile5]
MASRLTVVAKELVGYGTTPSPLSATDSERLLAAAPWTVPTALLAGWMVWPGLTESFKEETFGLKASVPASKPVAAPAAPAKELFRGPGKYTFVRSEIGEAPTLEED